MRRSAKSFTLITTLVIAAITAILSRPTHSEIFPPNTQYEVCFTPGSECAELIVNQIDHAKESIDVQAYSFTSKPIAKALAAANRRDIAIRVILDKSQFKHNKYSSAKYFLHQQIPVWIDYKPSIAHNKVMIIDHQTVITGSFNFTKAAQEDNAENVLVIHDIKLANAYENNFNKRRAESKHA